MALTEGKWKNLRIGYWRGLGVARRTAEYLTSLEWGDTPRCIQSLRELSKTPGWHGRVIRMVLPRSLYRYTDGRWKRL